MATKRVNGEGNIRKRKDGRWEATITISYDPITHKQIRKSFYGKTRGEVRDKLLVYMAEKNANLEKQLKELQQKQLNAKRSSGSAKTTASASVMDDFMLGFFS